MKGGPHCWRCRAELAECGFCVWCGLDLSRERAWQEAGFNPDGTTPFAPEPEPLAEPEDPA